MSETSTGSGGPQPNMSTTKKPESIPERKGDSGLSRDDKKSKVAIQTFLYDSPCFQLYKIINQIMYKVKKRDNQRIEYIKEINCMIDRHYHPTYLRFLLEFL